MRPKISQSNPWSTSLGAITPGAISEGYDINSTIHAAVKTLRLMQWIR